MSVGLSLCVCICIFILFDDAVSLRFFSFPFNSHQKLWDYKCKIFIFHMIHRKSMLNVYRLSFELEETHRMETRKKPSWKPTSTKRLPIKHKRTWKCNMNTYKHTQTLIQFRLANNKNVLRYVKVQKRTDKCEKNRLR